MNTTKHACWILLALTCGITSRAAERGFESVEVGKLPAGYNVWAPNEGEGPGSCAVSDARARTGTKSLRLEIPKGGYMVVWEFLPVTAGKNYLFSAHAFLDPGTTAGANANIYWSDGPSQAKRLEVSHPSTPATRKTGAWQELKLLGQAPADATHAQVVLRLSGKGQGTSGVVLYDDLSLTQVADNLTLGPGGALIERIAIPNADFAKASADGIEGWALEIENGEYKAAGDVDAGNPVAKLAFVKRDRRRCRGSLVSKLFRIGKPLSHYRVSVRVRGRNAMCRLLLHFYDAKTEEKLNFWAKRLPAAKTWRSSGGTIRILPRFRDRELACRIELRLLGSGEAWFDNVALEAIDAPKVHWKKGATYRWNANSPLLTPREPADGAASKVNPPSFVFPPTMGARTYRVEISAAAAFDKVLVSSPPNPNNCYLHSEPLDGDKTWHWRAVTLDHEGSTVHTSPVWSFTIANGAVDWPFPAMSELVSRVGPHPRLYVNAATLEQDRKRVLVHPGWPAYYARVEKMLDAKPSTEPVDYWDFDPWGEVYRQVYSPSSHMHGVYTNCAFVYLMTGDKRFLNKAKTFMLEQAAWDPEGPTCFQWLDQVGRSIMLQMSIAYDWLHNDLTPEERKTIEASLMGRIRTTYGTQVGYDCLKLKYYPRNSHGITILGMMCTTSLALLGHAPEVTEIFEYVVPYYCAMFPPWGGDDGGWSEGVNYALWSVSGHMQRWETIRSALGIDLFRKPWYANQPWWRLYCSPAFVKTSWFGDGHPSRVNDAQLLSAFASIYGEPHFRWHADNAPGAGSSENWASLLRHRDVAPKPPADIAQSRAFHDVGWAFMHSDLADPQGVVFGFKSSPHGSYSHSHADQNSFVLYAHGKSLAIDSGYYESYGSAHHFGFTKQTRSHNAILVDGTGQAPNDITSTGELTVFVHGAGFDFVAGQAAAGYRKTLDSWERQVLFVRPSFFVMIDNLKAPKPSTYQWLLHTGDEPRIDKDTQAIRTAGEGAFLYTDLLLPRGLEFSVSDEFDIPPLQGKVRPVKQYHVTASTFEPTAAARFVTVIAPCKAGDTPPRLKLEQTETTIVLTGKRGGDDVLVLLEPEPGKGVRHGDWSSDAQLLAVSTRAGTLTHICMVRGTACRRGDAELLTAEASSTVSLSHEPSRTLIGRDPKDIGWVRVRLARKPEHVFLARNGRDRADGNLFAAGQLQLPAVEWSEAYYGAKPSGSQRLEVVCGDAKTGVDAFLSWRDRYVFVPRSSIPRGCYRIAMHVAGNGNLVAPWPGIPARVSGDAVSESPPVWLVDKTAPLSWDPTVRVSQITYHSCMPSGSVAALVKPAELADLEGRIFLEAESSFKQQRGQAKPYTHRAFLSNGTGLGSWTELGHELSWPLNVPAAGTYALVLKGAVWDEAGARRTVAIDGHELNEGIPTLFPYTDGFGATRAQWRHFTIANPNAHPIPLKLTPGQYTLTLTNHANGMNLDYLALVPLEE